MAYNSSYLGAYSQKIVRSFNLVSFMILKGSWDHYDFMNLGYFGNKMHFIPEDKDKKNLSSISLYAKALEGIPEGIHAVLEIGSGLGGGCYLLKKYYKIAEVTGIDYAGLNVLYSNKKFKQPGIRFIRCAAETAHQLNQKFDLILSVEAAILFYDWELFFKNVSILLTSNGSFVYADLLAIEDKTIIEKLINSAGLKITYDEDISEGVINSLNERPKPKKDKSVSYKILQRILLIRELDQFDAYHNSDLHKKLINKELVYMKYIIQKK